MSHEIRPPLNAVTATAVRRAAVWAAALAATLTGHLATVGDARLLPVTPMLWVAMIALTVPFAALAPPAGLRAWGPARVLATLLAAQAALHLCLIRAPWAFGIVEHPHGGVLTPAAAGIHLTLAVVFTIALCGGQRLLMRAAAVARALLGDRRPARGLPRAPRPLPSPAAAPRCADRAPRTSRGPPRPGLRPATGTVTPI